MQPEPSCGRRRRVPAMPPDQRRAALIAATLPLLREHGVNVSTRQIAEAAGVAEGTIFGVFPDKRSLIYAAVLSAFDPEPVQRELRSIDPTLDLRGRFHAVATLMSRRMADNAPLIDAMRRSGPPPGDPDRHGRAGDDARHTGPKDFFVHLVQSRQRLIAAVAEILEPDRHSLRHPPTVVAELLLSMLAMQGRHGFSEIAGLDNDAIVTLLLDGLLVRPGPTTGGDPVPC